MAQQHLKQQKKQKINLYIILYNGDTLLTKGNKATYYEYKTFIDANENYPRIGRIKYLAEHKLSTDKVSPKKIINWFGTNEPLSGFGKMILGESLILEGNNQKGISLLKKDGLQQN